jgi:hypothetical protein
MGVKVGGIFSTGGADVTGSGVLVNEQASETSKSITDKKKKIFLIEAPWND